MQTLRITTYNIHKGFSQFNRRMMVHELRARLRTLNSDIVFLQEVQGQHLKHAARHDAWPEAAQHEFLAEDFWQEAAYGRNVVYDHGHHGNAILSRFPLLSTHNQDVTDLRFERRGILHGLVALPDGGSAHCVCVHLSLFGHSRQRQMTALSAYLDTIAPSGTPLIIAGDFNDWRNRADQTLRARLGLTEVFCGASGRPARSFPAIRPLFRLDRIYVRGFAVERTEVHLGTPWAQLSDHAALSAELRREARRP